jgi:hypothetical protein
LISLHVEIKYKIEKRAYAVEYRFVETRFVSGKDVDRCRLTSIPNTAAELSINSSYVVHGGPGPGPGSGRRVRSRASRKRDQYGAAAWIQDAELRATA